MGQGFLGQGTPDRAVAVFKGVDRLKVQMGDGRLNDGLLDRS